MNAFTITDRGYSIQEVNNFIDSVISQTESMLEKMKNQQQEEEKLKQELVKYRQMEKDLKVALSNAQNSSYQIKRQAQDDRARIIEEARQNASRIVNDALLRAERIEFKSDTLERNMRIFKKKLKLIVEQQLSVIDEIEDLDLKD